MSKKGKNGPSSFTFSKNDIVGAADAEEDGYFLEECFVETDDLYVLGDCESPKRVVVGRTGAGKTALLQRLHESNKNVISIMPDSLALAHIANNDVIRFFNEIGVNLTPFYTLLWKHILVVELLKKKFNIKNDGDQKQYAKYVRNKFYKKDRNKEVAIDYLENWGNKFWLTTDERIKELTTRVESKLQGSVGADVPMGKLSLGAAKNLQEEEKREIVERGKKAVSQVQIRELEQILQLLNDDIFDDRQQKYYVTIDTLDEGWVEDGLKFELIKALIDTIRTFRKVENVKICIAMRQDLLENVIFSTKSKGFQEEKYEQLYLRVRWTAAQLEDLIDRRVSNLVRRKYTKASVGVRDILPSAINKEDSIKYLLDRTFMRPRDIIAFLNEIIAVQETIPPFSAQQIADAEHEYSHKRLKALATEWELVHANLFAVMCMFARMPERFEVSKITEEWIEERFTDIVNDIGAVEDDPLTREMSGLYEANRNLSTVRNNVLRALYVAGFIGIRTRSGGRVNWSFINRFSLAPGEVKPNSMVHIHKAFHMALSIRRV